jgi:hypothetical protein
MNEETFKVRAYGFGELAQLYFPNITKKSAAEQLRNWIAINKPLKNNLYLNGLKPKQRVLTPLQVNLIVSEFGSP